MTSRRIYTATVPSGSFGDQSGDRDATQQLAKLAKLGGDGSVSRTGGQPDELTVQGQFRGRYADRAGLELQELLGSADVGAVPFYAVGETDGADGYYEPETGSTGRVQPQSGATSRFRARLVREGTRNTHWLGVVTRPTEDVDHPFGNDTAPVVGIPAAAQRVRAVDEIAEPEQRELSPAPTATVTAELGDVDLYDPTALPFDEPVYLFDLPYAQQGNVDAAVFDTYGEASRTNADDAFVWAQVFAPSHEFTGDAVLENGILRLTISEPEAGDGTGELTAERWGGYNAGDYGDEYGGEDWYEVDLPDPSTMNTEWRPLDLDVVETSPVRIAAQLEFEAVAGDQEGGVYAVNIALDRGHDAVLIEPPDGSDPIPDDLQTHLDQIASERVADAMAEQLLVERSGVRP